VRTITHPWMRSKPESEVRYSLDPTAGLKSFATSI
jgi:hypothetical protein